MQVTRERRKEQEGKERKKETKEGDWCKLELGGCGLGCASCGTTLEVSGFN